MADFLNTYSAIVAAIFIEAMPFLVIGAFFSAAIEVFVSTERLIRHIPKSVAGGLALGISAGFILPTCECGVVPIVRRLIRKGVPPFIAIGYMLAAPIVNPVVIASTYIAFQGNLTMVFGRITMAVVTASIIGLYARSIKHVVLDTPDSCACCHGHDHSHEHDHEHIHIPQPFTHKIRAVLVHTALEFMDMGKFLILGAMAAAAFKTLLPENIVTFFSGSDLLSITGMMILAILLSICSEADAFVAASFQTFSSASKLAFVAIGPMVDLKLIGMYAITFTRKIFISLIVGPCVLIFIFSWLFSLLEL